MFTKEQFVEEVLTWIETPFHHEGRVKGAGADCVGIVLGSAKALGLVLEDAVHYSTGPTNGLFEKYVTEQTEEVPSGSEQIGDLVMFRIKEEPQHIAVITQVSPTIMITHAFAPSRKCVETNLDDYWKSRIVSIRRLRGIK